MKLIAEALNMMAKKYIHHYDIKPENMLISGKSIKLGDFGIAKKKN